MFSTAAYGKSCYTIKHDGFEGNYGSTRHIDALITVESNRFSVKDKAPSGAFSWPYVGPGRAIAWFGRLQPLHHLAGDG